MGVWGKYKEYHQSPSSSSSHSTGAQPPSLFSVSRAEVQCLVSYERNDDACIANMAARMNTTAPYLHCYCEKIDGATVSAKDFSHWRCGEYFEQYYQVRFASIL